VQGHVYRSANVPEWTFEFIRATHVKNRGARALWQGGG